MTAVVLLLCPKGVPSIGDIRLTGVQSANSAGVVEFYAGGTTGWVTICNDFWDSLDASVACVQLGYESGVATFFDTSSL